MRSLRRRSSPSRGARSSRWVLWRCRHAQRSRCGNGGCRRLHRRLRCRSFDPARFGPAGLAGRCCPLPGSGLRSTTTRGALAAQGEPANPAQPSAGCLDTVPVVCRSGSPNSTFTTRQNWITASENTGGRPERRAFAASHTRSLSSQIRSDPSRFRASL